MKKFSLFLALAALTSGLSAAAVIKKTDTKASEARQSEFYERVEIPTPAGEVCEVSSLALMPGKKIAIGTRRGDVWIAEGAYDADLSKIKWTKFASSLHEPLGMFWKEGSLYATNRPDFTRMTDTNGDGKADRFDTICSKWGINGDYHEYAFGSEPDKNGDVWVVLCLTGSFTGSAPDRSRGTLRATSPLHS